MKLTRHEISYISHARDILHTEVCRRTPGNVKGDGGNEPGVSAGRDGRLKVDLGGYRCVCDFMTRIEANKDVLTEGSG